VNLVRFHVRLFGFYCLLAFCLAAAAAEQPILVARVEFTSVVGAASPYSGLQFLTDELLIVSNGRSSSAYAIYDVTRSRIVGTGSTCAFTGSDLWTTPRGNILAACPEGLVLYDREFHELARIKVRYSQYTVRETLIFSPTRELVAVDPLPRQGVARVFATDTLTETTTIPSTSKYISGIFSSGYVVYEHNKSTHREELQFHGYSGAKSTLVSTKPCGPAWVLGISETEFVKPACGQTSGEIIDVLAGKVRLKLPQTDFAWIAYPSSSGYRFALSFEEDSKSRKLNQALNPFSYLAALATYAPDRANLFRLRIYDRRSGEVLAEFHWKMGDQDPMRRIDNSGVALSPNGEYVAFVRGTAVEVYRVPDSMTH
jgi:hypothetical protein